ncbi:MAG: phospho-N-acetylmuramoyl-pentapeptide-transferase [Candidatus Omnitrophica bacterium]|nr:phospho-N-acetylmuramoyl-pentapeptide-transferase [Candidatus Omnitrophota bacterium]MDD4012733.1 phospho-N-acetylmuramoyl-pentapeptide-transferase [Candidatus Omnitrophota bacterium]
MFYNLLYPLKDLWFGFNIFRYITFRTGMAAVTAFALCILFGPALIEWLRRVKAGQYVRKEHVQGLAEYHNKKEGTPTMGGLLIILSVLISTLLWARIDNDYIILCLGGMIWLACVGFMDDYLKLKKKSAEGIHGKIKMLGQVGLALIVGLFVIRNKAMGAELYIPFLKNAVCDLGLVYILFVLLVIVGSSNALNLTDGLDGLAVGCTIFITLTLAVMSYITGHYEISGYLNVFYLPGAGELSVFCAALTGAAMGFLWFNCHPASVFMGDTGSLSLGGSVAIVSVLLKKEFLLLIVGGVLVVEALSVILQVGSYKLRKKRIFLMSPIHHHFQMKGLHESKITIRLWIISAILALAGLATLKVR